MERILRYTNPEGVNNVSTLLPQISETYPMQSLQIKFRLILIKKISCLKNYLSNIWSRKKQCLKFEVMLDFLLYDLLILPVLNAYTQQRLTFLSLFQLPQAISLSKLLYINVFFLSLFYIFFIFMAIFRSDKNITFLRYRVKRCKIHFTYLLYL